VYQSLSIYTTIISKIVHIQGPYVQDKNLHKTRKFLDAINNERFELHFFWNFISGEKSFFRYCQLRLSRLVFIICWPCGIFPGSHVGVYVMCCQQKKNNELKLGMYKDLNIIINIYSTRNCQQKYLHFKFLTKWKY
jgi:hypothetical protein